MNNTIKILSIAIFTLTINFCSSTEEKAEPTPPVVDSSLKISVIDAFQILAAPEAGKDYAALAKIEAALAKNPAISSDPELRAKAKNLFGSKGFEITCDFKIEEPNESSYVMSGFSSPVQVVPDCAGSQNTVSIELVSEKQVRFKSNESDSDTELKIDLKNKEKNPIYVTALSVKPEENGIRFRAANRYFPRLLENLKKFGVSPENKLIANPARYQFQNRPVAFSRNYEETRDLFFIPDSVNSLKAKNMELSVAPNGIFSMGVEKDGEIMDLIYGHPNGAYSDSMGSTYSTIYVDGNTYKFNQLDSIVFKTANKSEIIAEGKIPGKNITVQQTTVKKSSKENTMLLKYRIINNTSSEISAGVRVLLDTWAGTNDGVPFSIPGVTGKDNTVYENELKFTPNASPVWETYDPNADGIVFLRNTMVGDGLTPPDEVAFASWPSANSSEWEYVTSPERKVTGDSGILSWWNPRKVSSGKELSIATEYSFSSKVSGVNLELVDREKGKAYISLERKNEGIEPITLKYTLSAVGGKILSDSANNSFSFDLKEEERLSRMIPVTIAGNGDVDVTVNETDGKTTKSYPFKVNITGKGASPSIWSSQKYPINYTDARAGLKLKGILINKETGKEIGSTMLAEERISDGQSSYSGLVDTGSFTGSAKVQIEEIDDKPKVTFAELPPPPPMGLAPEESFSLMDDSYKNFGKIVSENAGDYEIELNPNITPALNQILYVVDSKKRIVGKVKIKEIGTARAIAVVNESFVEVNPGMNTATKD